MASAEKVLVDSLYLSTRRGRRFRSLPELELGSKFSITRARAWVRQIADDRIREIVAPKLESLWRQFRPASA